MQELRANTAVDVLIGPFVDATDGYTAEEGLTPSVLLSKNGQALAAKNDATDPVHDDAGYYNCELDATDTDTEGTLDLIVESDGTALPVRHSLVVLSEAAWDSKYVAKDDGYMDVNVKAVSEDTAAADDLELFVEALGTDDKVLISTDAQDLSGTFDVNAKTLDDGAITAAKLGADAITADKIADDAIASEHLATGALTADAFAANALVAATFAASSLDGKGDWNTTTPPTAAAIRTEIDSNSTQLAAIVADTNELQADWTDGGRLDLLLDATSTHDAAAVVTALGTGSTLTECHTATSVTVSDKTGFSLAAAGLDLITAWTVDVTGTVSGNSTHDAAAVLAALGDGAWATEAGGTGDQLTGVPLHADFQDGGRLDLIFDELTSQGDTNEGKLDTVDTVVDSIKSTTDKLDDMVEEVP